MPLHPSPRPKNLRLATALVAVVLAVAGCAESGADQSAGDQVATTELVDGAVDTDGGANADAVIEAGGFFDEAMVHDIAVEMDPDAYQAAVAAYIATGDKEWIEATVTIDGVTYTEVGLRLKGNSSLRTVSADAAPESLPWLIRLDKFVDDQNHEGYADLVIRSNTSETALNEAVALDLLDAAGLASQAAVSTSFSVNGSDAVLRLTIEHPDDVWMAAVLDADGALYKAESTGDYSYRGEDFDSYDEVFDQEAGKDNADLSPLIDFLDFINTSDDTTFEAELGDHLDVESFATYLAMMDLVDNFDDIDGPGNNSYLYYDTESDQFTVVPWDLNLAFGAMNVGGAPGGGGGFAPGGGVPPEGGVLPEGGVVPEAGALQEGGIVPEGGVAPGGGGRPAPPAGIAVGGVGGPGGPVGENVLAERFRSTPAFAALYADALVELRAELFDSGEAQALLDARVGVLSEHQDLVDASTLDTEAEALATALG